MGLVMSFTLLPKLHWLRVLAVLPLFSMGVAAQQVPSDGGQVSAAFISATQQWLDDAVVRANAASAAALRMDVGIGALDSRLRLAPCTRVDPYIPVGARLWGKTRLGLRCVDGAARWNVFLPITVKAFGPAWVLRDNVLAGAVLTLADAQQEEADWAAENSPVVSDAAQWVGQIASRSIAAGQPLRLSMIKPAQVFMAGTQVRVVAGGAGFQVTSDAQALTPGVIGQMVRLRMENGKMTTGVVLDARTVRLSL